MPRARKQQGGKIANLSKGKDVGEMGFDVVEWLEGERLEHERRMQELGCTGSPEKSGSHNPAADGTRDAHTDLYRNKR